MHQSPMWAELGDQRPMELMEVMLTALLLGSQSGKLFKVIFLHQIPKNLKDLDAVQFQKLEAMELAKFAEFIWDARKVKKTLVAAIRAAPEEEDIAPAEKLALEKVVASLTILSKKKWQAGRSRGGGQLRCGQDGTRGSDPGGKSLCERHEKFREDAWHCDNPKNCSWLEIE